MSASPKTDPPEEKKQSLTPKRRNWRKSLFILTALLLILLALLNGPIARWAVHRALNGAFTSIGMHGEVRVEGTIISGLGLYDLNYGGDQGIEKVSLNSLSLDYDIRELFDGKIRTVSIEKFILVIDSAKFPEKEDEEEKDQTATVRETLAQLRPYLTSPNINISEVDVTLLDNEKLTARFSLQSLDHKSGSGIYALTGFQATDADQTTTPLQNVELSWMPEKASITRLELLPEISLEEVQLDWANNLKGDATLNMDDAVIKLSLSESIQLRFHRGQIRSDFLNRKFSLDLPVQFILESADISLTQWEDATPQWDLSGRLEVASLKTDDFSVRDAVLKLDQKDTRYSLDLAAVVDGIKVESKVSGVWLTPEDSSWWSNITVDYEFNAEAQKITQLASRWLAADSKINLAKAQVNLRGTAELKQSELKRASSSGTVAGIIAEGVQIPSMNLSADYTQDAAIQATLKRGEQLDLSGTYDLKTQSYSGALKINEPDPAWINALARAFNQNVQFKGTTAFTWQGHGSVDLDKPQIGKASITRLCIVAPQLEPITLTGETQYSWPESLSVTDLQARQGEWSAKANMAWDGKTINFTGLDIAQKDQLVTSLKGSMPYRSEIRGLDTFFKQTQPWDLKLTSKPSSLTNIKNWFGLKLPENLSGKVAVDLEITGSPAVPSIQGEASLTQITGLDESQNEPLDAIIKLRSEGEKLRINTEVTEGKARLINGKFTIPFEPDKLIQDPEIASKWIESAELDGTVDISTLPLARLKRFVPQLEKIQGTMSGEAKLSGTLSQPRYTINLNAKAPLIQLRESTIGNIKDIDLQASIDEKNQLNARMTARINGGKFEVTGKADITDPADPSFDVNLVTEYAMIHRDDLLSIRANTNLKLSGTMKDATLSGNVGIVESLVYKDMELIPIGVPSSEVAKVQLPSLDAGKADSLPIPEPFAAWKLDVKISTTDPILIRGNVASGYIHGALKVGGTLASPRPDGTLIAKDVKAKLPFSILEVQRGEIKFSPDSGLIPTMSIRGKSTIGSYDVSVFVYGSASSPKTTLTSYPPLAESEIMTLLGTGTTTSGLEDRDVASFKAFQVFLMKLKKRNDKPGGNELFKKLLEGVDNLNLNVGEKDRFTGRKYSSATIEVGPKWHLTAQVDAQQQTRGLVVYVIRFR